MKPLVIITLLFFSLQGIAQDTYFQESSKMAEEEAINITNDYNRQLALNGEQLLLFQKKVEEFLIRRYKIESDFSGKEKLDMLYAMQLEETAEMNDVLTRPQLQVYKKIKPQIQPLEVISTE